MTKMALKN